MINIFTRPIIFTDFFFSRFVFYPYVNLVRTLGSDKLSKKTKQRMNNHNKRPYRLIDIAPEYCFDVTLGDFKQIIENDFIKLEAE